jgi:putative NADH-flavin reductase
VKRYIAVGGAGPLEIAPGKLLKDSGKIPPEWLPAINEGTELLKLLRADKQLETIMLSPWLMSSKSRNTFVSALPSAI